MPWRLNLDPYAIVVSEIMLQQTQVDRVIPKFTAWLKKFPDWAALAKAPLPAVLQQWQGLGYNRRALSLQRCAEAVANEWGGRLPREEEKLVALPGIGPYTAGAIRAFAFNEPDVVIETNIRGVFLHHFFSDQTNIADQELVPLVAKALDAERPREWYWALMDYGAYLKKTAGNPARRSKHHARQAAFAGSNREVRGAIVRILTRESFITYDALQASLRDEGIKALRINQALAELESEGFVSRNNKQKTISLAR